MEDEAKRVWAAVTAIYDGFLSDDREAIDRHIAPDATIWDSSHPPLVRGKQELDAVRDARPSDSATPSGLRATDPVIDVFGDVALVRHLLLVAWPPESGQSEQRIRNTSVWRKLDSRWLCVHNHEDLLS
jgi:ketosteroid isomerase-like protein